MYDYYAFMDDKQKDNDGTSEAGRDGDFSGVYAYPAVAIYGSRQPVFTREGDGARVIVRTYDE